MKSDDKLNVECTGCGAEMTNVQFNSHDCPNTVEPIKGESFDEFSARCNLKKHGVVLHKDSSGYAYLLFEDGGDVSDEWVEDRPEVSDALFILS